MQFGNEIEETEEEIEEITEDEEIIEYEEIEETEDASLSVVVTSENSSVYKGYLYANSNSEVGYEQKYNSIEEITITNSDYIDRIFFKETDSIALTTGESIELDDVIYYQKTRVSVQEFEDVLGTDGEIRIYDGDGNCLGIINSETEIENDYYVFEYEEQYNNIIFDIENPINDGTLKIYNDKAIKEDVKFNSDEIDLFDSINITANFSMFCGEEATNYEAIGSILLKETESKMTIEIDNAIWSTEYENSVSININLKTDSERYELFTNPTIEIEFPAEVQSVDITGLNLLYKNGLTLEERGTYINDNGNIVLRITLTGSQLLYAPGSATEGTVIAMDLNIVNNKLTTNGIDYLKMTYTNEASDKISYLLEGKEAEELEIEFVGKEEIITAMVATNQTNESSSITYDGETAVIDIDAEGEGQTISVTGTMLNNFSSSITNVYVIGKIPSTENTNAEGYSYGTTFDTMLTNAVSTNGLDVSVYYSEEENPSADSESWNDDTTDITKYKTFKIVINNSEINVGDYLSFSYDIYLSENIGFNAVGYGDYVVYYKMGESEFDTSVAYKLVSETRELTIEDLSEENIEEISAISAISEDSENASYESTETENEAILEIGSQVSQGGNILTESDIVYERQVLKYTIVVSNVSDYTISNITIKANAENANLYYYNVWLAEDYEGEDEYWLAQWTEDVDGEKGYEEIYIETLNSGESATFEYQVIVKEDVSEVYGNITISADGIEEATVTTSSNQVNAGKVEILTSYKGTEAAYEQDRVSGGVFNFKVYLKNITEETLENVVVTVDIPSELIFDEDTYILGTDGLETEIQSTANGISVKIYIDQMEVGYENTFYFNTTSNTFDTSLGSQDITILANAVIGEEIFYSNDYTTTIYQAQTSYEYSWVADSNKTILDDGDYLTYTFTLENTGLINMNYVAITDVLPSGVIVENVLLNGENVEYTLVETMIETYAYDQLTLDFSLNSDDTATVEIITRIDTDYLLNDQTTVDNKLEIDGGGSFDGFITDVISYAVNIVEEDEEDDTTEYENEDVDEDVDEDEEEENTDDLDEDDSDDNSSSDEDDEDSQNDDSSGSSQNNVISSSSSSSSNDNEDSESNEIVITQKTYSISGTIWLDTNKDGIKNSNESKIDDVSVILYGTVSNGGIDISNKIEETKTDSSGDYEFTDISVGTYIVVFEYDTEVYYVTTYQSSSAISIENSDATSKTLSTGEKVAITDSLELNGLSLINIDLGLIPLDKFDLTLNKYVSNIKVINDEETKNYEYDNSTYTKIEVRSKYYESTTLEITYNIEITNEGDISGYVNKITDYLPEGMELVSQDDSGWYQDEDGNLYNSDLAGTEIKSGQSKTVTLVVRQSLASGEALQLVNGAEIAESTNSLGLIDEDSTAGNAESSEDDYGESTIIVSISTGVLTIIRNLVLITAGLACIAALVIFVKRGKHVKRIYR